MDERVAAIANRFPDLDTDLISLDAAPIEPQSVVLSSGDSETPLTPIATFQSSGLFPHATLINTTLTRQEKERALAALAGQTGALAVTYCCHLTITGQIAVTLQGDVAPILEKLLKQRQQYGHSDTAARMGSNIKSSVMIDSATLDDCLEQIEQALANGYLTVQTEQHNVFEQDGAVEDAIVTAKRLAATQILTRLERLDRIVPDTSLIEISTEESVHQTYALELQTDIASWFEEDNGLDYVQTSPVPIAEPERSPLDSDDSDSDDSDSDDSDDSGEDSNDRSDPDDTDNDDSGDEDQQEDGTDRVMETLIKLGFDPEDIPISSITVTCGEEKVTLRRPRFRADTILTKGKGDRIAVETDYTRLGKNFIADVSLEADETCLLTPEQLGISPITVDGTLVKSTGARKAQVKVAYMPNENGTKDRRTVTFYERDEEWLKQWYVISRSPELAGTIAWSWTETPARGSSIRHDTVETDQGDVVLRPTE